jgi:NitT/TauT family transport system substrate-binding protein
MTPYIGIGLAALAAFAAGPAAAVERVTFGTNWRAEAEHGGFYQAVVDGTYARYGLDVTIVQGGPQANNLALLLAGRIDFAMGLNLIQAFEAAKENVPLVVVAAEFQKDPMAILSHPGAGLDRWSDLPKATAFVGEEALVSVYQWLRHAYGFHESNVRPYAFNPGPFIADKDSVLLGYVTSEPYTVEKDGGFRPNVFLLADHGYSTYSTTIVVRRDTIDKNSDLVRRFVDASAIGWRHYLYGDNAKANAAIKAANPDITDGEIAYSIAKMKEYGIVDSGDALTMGIGAMTDARVQDFYREMVEAGVAAPGLDVKKAYTLQFVEHSLGVAHQAK